MATALEGEAALKHLSSEHADVAIVDLMLPGINGSELARRLHALYPTLRVVLTSAYHLSERQLPAPTAAVVGSSPPLRAGRARGFLRAKLASSTPSSPPAHAAADCRTKSANLGESTREWMESATRLAGRRGGDLGARVRDRCAN